ncbi:MAG: hypothetical protein FWF75_08570 [Propionibacteriaceae bacterium]|nr:hypothetical protein [Propionibacteriaceae bacterium]
MDYEQRIGAYIERAFTGVAATTQVNEAKAELRGDLVDRYRTLVAQGQSPPGAYETTIASVGDIFEVVDQVSDGSWQPAPPTDAPPLSVGAPRNSPPQRASLPQPRHRLLGGLEAPWYPAFVIVCWAIALVGFGYAAMTPHLRPYLLLIPILAAAVHGLVYSVTAYSEASRHD